MRLLPTLVLVSAIALSGCVPLAVGGAASGAGVVASERGVGAAIDDQWIRAKINKAWLDYDASMYDGLRLSVQEGRVLVMGRVAKEEQRAAAARLAWQVEGVKDVANEVQVGEPIGIGTALKDNWIVTQIRSSLTFEPEVSSRNISLECVDGVVYVTGVAQDAQEQKDIISIARGIDGVKRVVSYMRVKDASGKPVAASSGAADPAPVAPVSDRAVERAPLK